MTAKCAHAQHSLKYLATCNPNPKSNRNNLFEGTNKISEKLSPLKKKKWEDYNEKENVSGKATILAHFAEESIMETVMSECTALLGQKLDYGGASDSGFQLMHCAYLLLQVR